MPKWFVRSVWLLIYFINYISFDDTKMIAVAKNFLNLILCEKRVVEIASFVVIGFQLY